MVNLRNLLGYETTEQMIHEGIEYLRRCGRDIAEHHARIIVRDSTGEEVNEIVLGRKQEDME